MRRVVSILGAVAVGSIMCLLGGCASTGAEVNADQPSSARKAANTNTQLAVAYLNRGNAEVALEKIERALQQDPKFPEAQTVAGIVYEQLGRLDKAEVHYRQAVRLSPDDGNLLNNYGQFLCTVNRVEDSLKYFTRAIEQPFYRTPEVALTNAGACLEQVGRAEEAECRYREALDANEEYPDALYRMSRSLCTRGENFRARAFLERYQGIAPESPESLWLCYAIETRLEDRVAAERCATQLASSFPDSSHARLLAEGREDYGFCG